MSISGRDDKVGVYNKILYIHDPYTRVCRYILL